MMSTENFMHTTNHTPLPSPDTIPYFDGHCDTISQCVCQGISLRKNTGHLDLIRLSRFQKSAQVFALFADSAKFPDDSLWDQCRRQQQIFQQSLKANEDLIRLCRDRSDLEKAAKEGKTAALLSIEGGELLACDPEKLSDAAAWGVKMVNVTWNHANALSGSNIDRPDKGLTSLGREFAREAVQCGIRVDVSHLSDPGFWDLVEMGVPVIASHSNSRVQCPHSRNLTDDMFKAIRDTGGAAGLTMHTEFIGGGCALEDIVRHVDHFMDLEGENTLALGGDWDGCDLPHEWHGIEDIPRLWLALSRRGYSPQILEKIFFKNWVRILFP